MMNPRTMHTRIGRMVTRWRLGLACLLAGIVLGAVPVQAQPQPQLRDGLYDHFRLGWFHHLTGIRRLPEIAETGAPLLMPYHDEELTPFLDQARELAMDVLPEIPRKLIDEQDYDAIAAYVAEHDDHPAVLGWYSADEPGLKSKADWSPPVMEAVYQAIRSESDKPVYLCFSYVEMDRGDVPKYRDAFDVMLVNHYPYVLGKLGKAKAAKDLRYWKQLIVKTADVARELDRPWLNILQAIGPRKGKEHQGWRLPTLDEARFQLYWSVLHDAEGALYFTYYWTRNVLESPGEPFEESGRTWFETVFKPLADEFNPLAAALLPRHAVDPGVQSSDPDVHAKLYRTAQDAASVLVIANAATQPRRVVLTLPGGDWQGRAVVGQAEGTLEGNRLTLTLAPHETSVYRFEH